MYKIIFRVLDIPVFIILVIGFCLWFGTIYCCNRISRPLKDTRKRKILFFVAEATYEAVKEKGVLHMVTDKEEGGYFDMVYTIHPFVSVTQTVKISDKNFIIEYGVDHHGKLRKMGFEYTALFLVFWGLLVFSIRLIRKDNINIIRSTDPFYVGLTGLLCSKLVGIPFCVSIHADYDLIYKIPGLEGGRKLFSPRILTQAIQRFVLFQSKMVMPIRESIAKYAIRHGAKSDAIRVIPHGIDFSPYMQKPDVNLKKELKIGDKKVISFVGRLAKENYVDDIIEIAVRVCKKRNDVIFLMVGDGNERESLERLTQSLQLSENVRFLGYQPWDRVARIRLISDISLCLMGGFSLIEAAAASTPIVAYDVDWHYELVKNDETGFLVAQGDIEGATNGILRLLDNPELSRRLGKNAHKLAIERHSLENTSKIKIKCYEELLGG